MVVRQRFFSKSNLYFMVVAVPCLQTAEEYIAIGRLLHIALKEQRALLLIAATAVFFWCW